ncbi:MAG: hypothetical protein ACRERX_15335 [Pseudomonas sp.]
MKMAGTTSAGEITSDKPASAAPSMIAQRLLELVRRIEPRRVSTYKRGPKNNKPKSYVDGAAAQAHASTARVLKQAREQRP